MPLQKPKTIKPYNQNEVNKKILARPLKVHPENEMRGPFDRYRDEHRAIYEKKRVEFLNTANKYRRNNEMALIQRKIILGRFADDILNYDFEQNIDQVNFIRSTYKKLYLPFVYSMFTKQMKKKDLC